MINNHMKRYSVLLVIRETQIKTTQIPFHTYHINENFRLISAKYHLHKKQEKYSTLLEV